MTRSLLPKLLSLADLQEGQQFQGGYALGSLATLLRANLPILPGFVIPSGWFQSVLQGLHQHNAPDVAAANRFEHLNYQDAWPLHQYATRLQQAIAQYQFSHEQQQQLAQQIQSYTQPFLWLRPYWQLPAAVPNSEETATWTPVSTLHGSLPKLSSRICACQSQTLESNLKAIWQEALSALNLLCLRRAIQRLTHLRLVVFVQAALEPQLAGYVKLQGRTVEIEVIQGLPFGLEQPDITPELHRFDRRTQRWLPRQASQQNRMYQVHYSSLVPEGTFSAEQLDGSESLKLTTKLIPEDSTPSGLLTSRQREQLLAAWEPVESLLGDRPILEWIWPGTSLQQLSTPIWTAVIGDSPLAQEPLELATPTDPVTSAVLRGLGASPGYAIGVAVVRNAQQIIEQSKEFSPEGTILVTSKFSVELMPLLDQLLGLVLEQGSLTSHGAIIARELGIPVVVGVTDACRQIPDGVWVTIDGDRGEILPLNAEVDGTEEHISPTATPVKLIQTGPTTSMGPRPLTGTYVFTTLSHPRLIPELINHNSDGIGLLRSEWFCLDLLGQRHPLDWLSAGELPKLWQQLQHRLQQCLDAIQPAPLFYRCFSFAIADFQNFFAGSAALPSALEPELLDLQLQLLDQLSWAQHPTHTSPIRCILPQGATPAIVDACQRRWPKLPLWLMVEQETLPAPLHDLQNAGIQGIVIGTSDLAQALSSSTHERDQPQASFALQQPEVIQVVTDLLAEAHANHCKTLVCGQLPLYNPEVLDRWIAAGLWGISVDINAIASVRQITARAEQRLILSAARQARSAQP